jgi:hypothetical protein
MVTVVSVVVVFLRHYSSSLMAISYMARFIGTSVLVPGCRVRA